MRDIRTDGYVDAVLGARGLHQHHHALSALDLYATGGLYGRVIDLPADKATERGIVASDETQAELGRLHVMDLLADALRWARLSGGGCLIPISDDGLLNEPLDINRVRRIEEFRAFSITEVKPTSIRYSDPMVSNFGQPEFYEIAVQGGRFIVHESRIVPVPGDPIPRERRLSGIPWEGRPVATRAFIAVQHYYNALELAVSIMRRKQQAIYKMAGLVEAISDGMEAQVQQRINLVDSTRGILNTVAVDAEDDYRIEDMNLSGIQDICQEFQVALSADTGIPVTMLFGRSPAGLNSTGDADFRTFYEAIQGDQVTKLSDPMVRILELIYAQSGITAPEDWQHIEWQPLEAPNEIEEGDVRLKRAQAASLESQAMDTAMMSGWLSEVEARDYAVAQNLYGVGDGE